MPDQSTNPKDETNQPELPIGKSLKEVTNWLRQQPPSGRTVEEIEAQIPEERDTWDD